ncbi:MAG: DUF5106 domain-containing protein [Bacteroides sp.]|nr:DUF5106 domain-containing protein [Bacteroides sp.]
MYRHVLIITICTVFFVSCHQSKQERQRTGKASPAYQWPVPPSMLTDEAERAAYVNRHYWEGLNYADEAWLADSAGLERVFADWVGRLSGLPMEENADFAANVITEGNGYPALQLRLAALAEKYFRDPNSPYRNEELYIPILKAVIAAPRIDELHKERPRYLLQKALMNRPGTMAADFGYVTREGKTGRMHRLTAEYLLLYFFNPGCHDCRRVAAYIAASPVLSGLVKSGRLRVLALYPDEDLQAWEEQAYSLPSEWITARYARPAESERYDLPAIPNLYLLDRHKKVLLKDAPVEQIEKRVDKETS